MKRIIFIIVMLLLCNIQFVFAVENEYEEEFDGQVTVSFKLQVGEVPEDVTPEDPTTSDPTTSDTTSSSTSSSSSSSSTGSSGSGTTTGGGAMPYSPDMFYNYNANSSTDTTDDSVTDDTTTTTTTPIDPTTTNPSTGDTWRQTVKNIAIAVLCITGILLIGELVYRRYY